MQRRLSDAEVAAAVGGRRSDQSLRWVGAVARGRDGEKSEREGGDSASSERQSGGHADSEERDEKLTAEEVERCEQLAVRCCVLIGQGELQGMLQLIGFGEELYSQNVKFKIQRNPANKANLSEDNID